MGAKSLSPVRKAGIRWETFWRNCDILHNAEYDAKYEIDFTIMHKINLQKIIKCVNIQMISNHIIYKKMKSISHKTVKGNCGGNGIW